MAKMTIQFPYGPAPVLLDAEGKPVAFITEIDLRVDDTTQAPAIPAPIAIEALRVTRYFHGSMGDPPEAPKIPRIILEDD